MIRALAFALRPDVISRSSGGGLTTNLIIWWLNHVEIVTAERIRIESTAYVRNMHKYYVSYKLTHEAQAIQRKACEQVAPPRAVAASRHVVLHLSGLHTHGVAIEGFP